MRIDSEIIYIDQQKQQKNLKKSRIQMKTLISFIITIIRRYIQRIQQIKKESEYNKQNMIITFHYRNNSEIYFQKTEIPILIY
ncbi:unnamed protein product [Paramecium pentaurelia]|uniref:Uncharacterized protein n=1 Tax=Paramecium pentaurelia TaxID=43138 RepID=A0A8S1Y0S3_9CILI|nr:unnamed protein product [Paramecium pentaurelia]